MNKRDKVLVVDDEPDIAALVIALLESEGFHAYLAPSGNDALAMIARLKPTAIVLDLSLPDLDGVQVLRLLKAQPSTERIPIVVVSAYTGRLTAADRAQVQGIFEKPFDLDELASCIGYLCKEARTPTPIRAPRRKVAPPAVSIA